MPVKTSFVTEQHLRNTPLPNHGGQYTVISHGYIIDQVRTELAKSGFTIDKELYKTSLDGQVAQGIYHLNYSSDLDVGLMFAWSNSYNKMMRFKCAIGGRVYVCDNGMVSGNLANFQRKHRGTSAVSDVDSSIQYQILHAKTHYDNLIADKEMLKQVSLTKSDKAKVIGRLFFEHEILTLTQVGALEREIKKPTHQYSSDPDSAWDLYNHVTLCLKDSHPRHFLGDHQKVHNFFVNEFGQLQNIYQLDNNDDGDDTDPTVAQAEEIAQRAEEVTEHIELTNNEFGVLFN